MKKTGSILGLVVLSLGLLIGSQYGLGRLADSSGYGKKRDYKEVYKKKDLRLGRSEMIKKEKPAPDDEYVDAIVAHTADGDVNPADGGFYIDKTGAGNTVHAGQPLPRVSTTLEGYGTVDDYGIYEVKNVMVGGRKVYVALSTKDNVPYPNIYLIYISTGVNDPTDTSSFGTAGWATHGKKNMNP